MDEQEKQPEYEIFEEVEYDNSWIDNILESRGNSPLSKLLIILAVLSVFAFCSTFYSNSVNPTEKTINAWTQVLSIVSVSLSLVGLILCAVDFLQKGYSRMLTKISIVVYAALLIGICCFGICLWIN